MAAKGERARRRAARAAELAAQEAERARLAERAARRRATKERLLGWLPSSRPAPGGVLARRRRREVAALVAGLVAINLLIWLGFGSPALSVLAAMVTLLVGPVLHTLMFR